MKTSKLTRSLLVGATLIAALGFQTKPQNGEILFKQRCAACHTVGNGKLVGPDLKNVTVRRKEDWILRFVKSSQAVVKSGDQTAVALFNENNKIVMPDQNLNDSEIKDILAYVKKTGVK